MNDEIKEILDRLYVYRNENDEMKYQPEDILTIEDVWLLLDYITNLREEKDKFKLRCFKALKLIRDNYGVLDKYGIDLLDDILNGGDEE